MASRLSRIATVAGALTAVLLMTVVFKKIAVINATTVGFAYLITILMIAASWGLTESVVASVVATFCLNYYFLPPVGTWAISDPENWVALFAFLLSSLIASNLSNRARRRTAEAGNRRIEMERLYELSRSILLLKSEEPMGAQIATELARIYEIPAVAIYDRPADAVYCGGEDSLVAAAGKLKDTVLTGIQWKDEETHTLFAPMSLGGASTGSVALRADALSNTALQALLNLIAIALENARSREIATRARATQQSQEFKSSLLDGLAHEFKTPLTSIRAATTALLSADVSDAAQRDDLMNVVDQEAQRLSRLVTEATYVARIEAGKVQINREWHSIGSLIQNVLLQMELQRDGRRIEVAIAPGLPKAFVDVNLVQLALRQLIDNALKYSPRESAVEITSEWVKDNVIISVRNQGDRLSEAERVRVFDRFYRGENAKNNVAGTGMGLPVARDILAAHGGDVYLRATGEQGTEFVMTIPAMTASI